MPPHSDAQQATTDPSFETLLPMQDLRTEIASKGLSGIGGAAQQPQAALRFYESLSDQERADIQQETDTWILAKGERGTLSKKSLLYQAMNQRREEVRPPTPITNGLSVSDIADKLGSAFGPVWHCRETTARLLGAVGWLEKAYHGGTQRRWLVPDYVIAKGYGDNIRHKIGAIGHSKDAVFPVFNPEHGQDIIWTLGVDAILKGLAALSTKKEKLGWLLTKHAYLPDKTVPPLYQTCLPSSVSDQKSYIGRTMSPLALGCLKSFITPLGRNPLQKNTRPRNTTPLQGIVHKT